MASTAILVPAFNDWPALSALLGELDRDLAAGGLAADVLVVDDASTLPAEWPDPAPRFIAIRELRVLRLARNLGAQRAIAVGLVHIALEDRGYDTVVVMDADGEDDPADVPRLIAAVADAGHERAVFAERRRRSEGAVFTVGYHLYRALHWLLTGRGVRVGNFSALPAVIARRLTVVADLWNHYAAAVFSSGFPTTTIKTHRRKRLLGRSHMSWTRLVVHGLSAIAVYSDVVSARLLIASLATLLGLGLLLGLVIVQHGGAFRVPGWLGLIAGLLGTLAFQLLTLTGVFTFLTLNRRSGSQFLPIRDCPVFIESVSVVSSRE